jgi:hypothetical protein
MNNKTVRNPSPEEIDIVNKRQMAPARPKQIIAAQSAIPIDNGLKPSTNPFEPAAFPCLLPSGNLIVPSGSILIRRMTTVEEQIFTDIAFKYMQKNIQSPELFMNAITDVLNNCVKSKVDVKDLLIIDKIPLFLHVLMLTYGNTFTTDFVCDKCQQTFAHSISLKDIPIMTVPDNTEYPRRIEILKSFEFPVTVFLQYPTIHFESLWLKDTPNVLSMFYALIADVEGTLPDGTPITMAYAKTIAENLHPDDKALLKQFINDFGKYGADLSIDLDICQNKSCEDFAQVKKVSFDLESLFFKIFQ